MDPSQDLLVTVETNFKNVRNFFRIQLRTLSTGEMHPLAGNTASIEYTLAVTERELWSRSIRICGEYVGILFMEVLDRNELVVWSWRTGVEKLVVLSTNLQSFAFLGDNFILGSTSVPAALLLYNLEQRPEDMTHDNTHLLRFLFGTHFQDPGGVSKILLASAPSPGWLPNAGQVPFQIAGDERMIALYSQFFDNWEDETFMIPMKTLLEQIEKLPIKEGLDVEWESYCPQLIEHVPDYTWEHGLLCSMFGMRYILPHLVLVDDKPMIVIRDVSPRRCLRASKEERKQSTTLYKAITSGPRRKPYPRSILKCVPLPESIVPYWNMILLISEDGIVIIDDRSYIRGPGALHLLTF